jgi:hypothetical protein
MGTGEHDVGISAISFPWMVSQMMMFLDYLLTMNNLLNVRFYVTRKELGTKTGDHDVSISQYSRAAKQKKCKTDDSDKNEQKQTVRVSNVPNIFLVVLVVLPVRYSSSHCSRCCFSCSRCSRSGSPFRVVLGVPMGRQRTEPFFSCVRLFGDATPGLFVTGCTERK